MKYYEYEEKDIYSNRRYEDISSTSATRRSSKAKQSKQGKKKTRIRRTLAALLCISALLAASAGGFYAYAYKTLEKAERIELDPSDLGISNNAYGDIQSIALLGIDTREDNDIGRSDAVVILTVDKKHNSIKLTSVARDTLVSIDGHGKDKLTHAYAYGRAQLAVKTLNQNFGLNITDYVAFNFFGLARLIDYIGGVTVTVTDEEVEELNRNIFPEMRDLGVSCPDLKGSGEQLLCGGQAVCYARIRHIDDDIQRGNRQKTVLSAMYEKIKKPNPIKLPKIAEMAMNECTTSLSTENILSLGLFAVLHSPKIKQLSIPNDNIPSSGKTIGGKWCFVYDLNSAAKEMENFIKEENGCSAVSGSEAKGEK